jgi:hypothetical protein
MKRIINCSNEGPGSLQRGDNCKNGVGSFANLFHKNLGARRAHTNMKAFWYSETSLNRTLRKLVLPEYRPIF